MTEGKRPNQKRFAPIFDAVAAGAFSIGALAVMTESAISYGFSSLSQ